MHDPAIQQSRELNDLVGRLQVNIGEPDCPIAFGGRGRTSILPADVEAKAGDHDFHVVSATPSVSLVVDIDGTATAEVGRTSFYQGQAHVNLKDSIFQASSAERHVVELAALLRETPQSTPALFVMTDGGPDHNCKHLAVQLSWLAFFIDMGMDMIAVWRGAPTQSWTNPAERVMGPLNLAMQNMALCRTEMDDDFEAVMKKCNGMSAVRTAAAASAEREPEVPETVADAAEGEAPTTATTDLALAEGEAPDAAAAAEEEESATAALAALAAAVEGEVPTTAATDLTLAGAGEAPDAAAAAEEEESATAALAALAEGKEPASPTTCAASASESDEDDDLWMPPQQSTSSVEVLSDDEEVDLVSGGSEDDDEVVEVEAATVPSAARRSVTTVQGFVQTYRESLREVLAAIEGQISHAVWANKRVAVHRPATDNEVGSCCPADISHCLPCVAITCMKASLNINCDAF